MSKCENCITSHWIHNCGLEGQSILDQLDLDLRLRKPYPSRIILGSEIFDIIKKEMLRTNCIGLTVNAEGEYKKLFGLDIEIDEYCRLMLAYGYEKPDQKEGSD